MEHTVTELRQTVVLDGLVDLEVAEARLFASRVRLLVELGRLALQAECVTGIEQFPVLEVAGSCRLAQATVTSRQTDAEHLVDNLPGSLAAMEDGRLFVPQVRAILQESRCCEPSVIRQVDDAVVTGGLDLAPADLRKLVRRAVHSAESRDREAADQRLATARAERRVWTSAEPDGMARICALLPAEAARAFALDLEALARAERAAGPADDVRTMDQRRADLFAGLPGRTRRGNGAADSAPQVILDVHVPMSTVLEHSTDPGRLDGYGFVSAEHVRLLMPGAWLRRIAVDSRSGRPLAVDREIHPPAGDVDAVRRRLLEMLRPGAFIDAAEAGHDPSAALARLVRIRDVGCSGPGCSQTAAASDIDHLIPYPAGPTAAWNLGPASRRCHRAKHSGWTLIRHPDGRVSWISPLGRRYERAAPHVRPPRIPHPDDLSPPRPLPVAPRPWWATDNPLVAPSPGPHDCGPHDCGPPAGEPVDGDAPPPF